MSPPSSRAQARRQRSLLISVAVVVVIAAGWLGAVIGANWSPRLGLDLAGGFSVVYKPANPNVSASDLNTAVNILNNRVNGLGVSGATVNTQGNQIVVQVPGVRNAQQVLNSIGQTAQLFFRPALCGAPAFIGHGKQGAQSATAPLPTCSSTSALTATNLNVQPNSNVAAGFTANNVQPDAALAAYPSTPNTNDDPSKTVLLPATRGQQYVRYLLGPAPLTGKDVTKALAQQTTAGAWVVNMNLNAAGSAAWDKMAQQYFHQIIGIELDGLVVSAPITQPTQSTFTSFNGQVQISGSFTQQQAQNLANDLTYGALPVKLEKLTTQTVSPTLGKASLDAGLGAGLAGLILVLLYVLIYYRMLGLVIVAGLGITGALLWAIISSLGHTSLAPSFDLAGVTGVIVSIGITVDSYIVYFERLKDETRTGRSVRTSVDRGFKSAWRTVLAADFISLAAAVVLYLFAVAQVRGFAFFLGLSTILDIFMTYFFTRPLVILLGRNERLVRARGFGISSGLAIADDAAATNGQRGRNGARRPAVAGGRRAGS